MEKTENNNDLLLAKVNQETAQIAWKELQRFFASGATLMVSSDLDLFEVAYQMALDNVEQVQQWMATGRLGKVTDEQAAAWLEADALVWAVVASPWVLVQPVRQLQ